MRVFLEANPASHKSASAHHKEITEFELRHAMKSGKTAESWLCEKKKKKKKHNGKWHTRSAGLKFGVQLRKRSALCLETNNESTKKGKGEDTGNHKESKECNMKRN